MAVRRKVQVVAAAGETEAAIEAATSDRPAERFINRELSWLDFNARVLEEALNPNHPLLERLRFLSISDSNLDEFYMVRVAGLKHLADAGIAATSPDGRTAEQQLATIKERATRLVEAQQRCWRELRPLMREQGLAVLDPPELTEAERAWLRGRFVDAYLPILTPTAIDPAHPFPFVANRGLVMIVELRQREGGFEGYGLVMIPERLERFIRLPGSELRFIRLEQALLAVGLDELFPGSEVQSDGLFRVLRDSDLEIEEESQDLVRTFESAI